MHSFLPVSNEKGKGTHWYHRASPWPPVPYLHPPHALFVQSPNQCQQVPMAPICLAPMMVPYTEGFAQYTGFYHHIEHPNMRHCLYHHSSPRPDLYCAFEAGNGQWCPSFGNRMRNSHSYISSIKKANSK